MHYDCEKRLSSSRGFPLFDFEEGDSFFSNEFNFFGGIFQIGGNDLVSGKSSSHHIKHLTP